MVYKITMYGIVDYDRSGFGKAIRGQIVLRDKISKITTARILACRYSKQNMGTNFGAEITLYDGINPIERIYYHNGKYRMEKSSVLLKSTPRGYSPVMHHIYTVNGKTGSVRLDENYQRKF